MGAICDVSVTNLEWHFKHSIWGILRWIKTLPKFLKNLKIFHISSPQLHVPMCPAQMKSIQKSLFFSFFFSLLKKETEQEISLKQAVSRHFWQILIPTKLKISQEQPVIQNFSASTPGKCRNRWMFGIQKLQNTFRKSIMMWASGWPDFVWEAYATPHVSVSYCCVTNHPIS